MRTLLAFISIATTLPAVAQPVQEVPVLESVATARGNWRYVADPRGSVALFSDGDKVLATVRCDRDARRVQVARAGRVGDRGAQMTLRTSFGAVVWPAQDANGNRGGAPAFVGAWRSPGDMGLDRIAYSRGRFALELPGMEPLVLPAWAEPIRVIEDCRPS